MKKIKNIVSNTPLFIGLGILYVAHGVKKVADQFFDLSFTLHVKLNTETGGKIKQVKEQMTAHIQALKAAAEAQSVDSSKLSRVFNKDLPAGVFQIGKKPTTDN